MTFRVVTSDFYRLLKCVYINTTRNKTLRTKYFYNFISLRLNKRKRENPTWQKGRWENLLAGFRTGNQKEREKEDLKMSTLLNNMWLSNVHRSLSLSLLTCHLPHFLTLSLFYALSSLIPTAAPCILFMVFIFLWSSKQRGNWILSWEKN